MNTIKKPLLALVLMTTGFVSMLTPLVFKYLNPDFLATNPQSNSVVIAILPLHTIDGITVTGKDSWYRNGALAYINQSLKDTPNIEAIPLTTVSDYLAAEGYPTSFSKIDHKLFKAICADLGCSHLINVSHIRYDKMETAMTVQLLSHNIDYESGPLSAPDSLSAAHRIQEHLSDYLLLGSNSTPFTPVKYSSVHEANKSYSMGLFEEGIANTVIAIRYYRCAIDKDPTFFDAHRKLLQNLSYTLQSEDAQSIYEKAAVLNLSPLDQLRLDIEYTNHLISAGDYPRSLTLTKNSLKNLKTFNQPELMAKANLNLAKLLSYSDPEHALTLLDKTISEFDKLENKADKALSIQESANIHYNNKNYDESMKLARTALALFKQEGDHFQVRQTNILIGYNLLSQKEFETVENLLNSYEDILTRSKNPNLKLSILSLWRAYSAEMNDDNSMNQIDEKIQALLEQFPSLKTARGIGLNGQFFALRPVQ